MREVIRVVQAVCDLVPTGGLGPDDRDLVITYIRWREEAASRLAEFTALLDAGEEHRALQLAEMEPRLPDFVAHLGLVAHLGRATDSGRPQIDPWAAYCRKHGLPVPPPLDPAAVERLHGLYRRGIDRSSPFYPECMAALQAGDEERALSLIRSIVRLAHDNDARAHMETMLRKKVVPQLAALRICLERGDADGVLGWLDEFERSGAEALLVEDAVYLAGIDARKVIMGRRAAVEAGGLLDAAAIQAKQQDWPAVRARIARIRRMENDWGSILTRDQVALLAHLEKQAAAIHAETRRQEMFSRTVASLMDFVERKQNQMLEQERLPLVELQKTQESFTDLWKQADGFNYPIPPPELNRLHAFAELLQNRLSARRDSGRLRKAVLIVPLVILVAGAVWAGVFYRKALNQLRDIEELRDGRLGGSANRALSIMMQSSAGWILNLSPGTQARLEALRKWAGLELKRLRDAEKQLEEIELLLDDSNEGGRPEELMEKLNATNEATRHLSHDDVGPVREKVRRLQEQMKSHFQSLLAKNLEKVRKALVNLEKLANELEFEKPVRDLAVTLASFQAGLREIEPLEHPTVPALSFPEEINAALRRLRGKARLYDVEMSAWTWAKEAMTKAERIEDYKAALEQCATLRFGESREAAKMMAAFPTGDQTAARLFFGGDLDAWQMARQQAARGYQFIPEDSVAQELERLSMLARDPNLNAPGAARKVLDAIRLREAFDPARGRITTPLIELVDRVVRVPQGDVIIKAYLVRELHGIIRIRGLAWGLHYCPALTSRMEELDSIVGVAPLRSGDWNRPEARTKWQSKLQKFFQDTAKAGAFQELAIALRDLVAPAAAGGVGYAGFVDETRTARLTARGGAASVVWGHSERQRRPVPVACTEGVADKNDLTNLRKWSPLLVIPFDSRRAEGLLTGK